MCAYLNTLLHADIEVNPYLAPCNKIGEKWKLITDMAQEASRCLGCEPDTLKNSPAHLG